MERFITEPSCNRIDAASAVISSCFTVFFMVSVTGFFATAEGAVAATLPRSPSAIGLLPLFEALLPLLSLRIESSEMLMESEFFLFMLESASPADVDDVGCSLLFFASCSRSFCLSNACAEGAGGGDGGGDGERLIGCEDSFLIAAPARSPEVRLALYLGSWKPCPVGLC